MNPLPNSKRLQLLNALVLFLAVSGRAEFWQSQQLNCAISLPLESGWTRLTPPADMVKVSIRSADRTKVITIYVSAIDQGLTEESFIQRFKNSWFEHGTGKGRVEGPVTLGGRAGYLLKDIANLGGKEVHRADTLVIDGGRLYQIDALGVGSDPMDDPVVTKCIASFRFLGQAALPPTNKPASNNPGDQLPERIGHITFVALVGIAIVFVLAKIARKRRD